MPQYDPYEDAVVIKQTKAPKSDIKPLLNTLDDASSHQFDDQREVLYSPTELHRRHSNLRKQNFPEKSIGSVTVMEPETALSPKILSQKEKRRLVEIEHSQQEDDEIRMILGSALGDEDGSEGVSTDKEFNKDTHMLVGGWMHRSRASCELLAERL